MRAVQVGISSHGLTGSSAMPMRCERDVNDGFLEVAFPYTEKRTTTERFAIGGRPPQRSFWEAYRAPPQATALTQITPTRVMTDDHCVAILDSGAKPSGPIGGDTCLLTRTHC